MNTTDQFAWPNGKRFAVSITFDDARDSQLDVGIPLLDQYGVRASFYGCPREVDLRPGEWRAAHKSGHEIGNHTLTHPCSGNFWFARNHALEEYTLDQMRSDMVAANDRLEVVTGARPTTFAYPCGQKFVGRGTGVRSYVPVAAELFVASRGFRDEYWSDPAFCDLAQVAGTEFDGMSVGDLDAMLTACREAGGWLVLAGHDIGDFSAQNVTVPVLEHFCELTVATGADMWCGTTAEIAAYIREVRATKPTFPHLEVNL